MPQYYKESGLKFTFPKKWQVIKLDEHRFYSYVSGRGFKGVDFIGLSETGKLYLVEVKNYGDRFPADGVQPVDAVLNDPEVYAQKYIDKFEDSFLLIRIIYQYYQRKFWIRKIGIPWLKYFYHPALLRLDWVFWWVIYQRLQKGNGATELVLWLELGDKINEVQTTKLQKRLELLMHRHFAKAGWEVQIINRNSEDTLGISASV